ncbi:MAG: asparaginase [Lachnospiraceae bacterium]|nr:asparaginase [Lachnospiraceae bacterium]MDY5742994.1 asparaginase [Lachnospiraceae bacterium]
MNNKKEILLLATGGTIASKQTSAGLAPQLTAGDLLSYIPSVHEICQVTVEQVFDLDSTNMTPAHWLTLAGRIRERYDRFDGFVITHGTDTLAYTAAALSYLIQDSAKPIVLTGAQKSIDYDRTDAKTNLLDSFLWVSAPQTAGVSIIFDGKVIAGTRAKKLRSKSFNAFSSINFPQLATIRDGRIYHYIKRSAGERPVRFYDRLEESVCVLKLIPGMKADILEKVFAAYRCIILESFGVGGIPATLSGRFYELCREQPQVLVIMTTQVTEEGSDMGLYEVGHLAKQEGQVLESFDMTLESVVAKAMWILGNFSLSREEQASLFYQAVDFDTIM